MAKHEYKVVSRWKKTHFNVDCSSTENWTKKKKLVANVFKHKSRANEPTKTKWSHSFINFAELSKWTATTYGLTGVNRDKSLEIYENLLEIVCNGVLVTLLFTIVQ